LYCFTSAFFQILECSWSCTTWFTKKRYKYFNISL
jgi:hypothetical protein